MLAKLVQHSKPATILIDPEIAEAETAAKKALAQHMILIIIGKCWVRYFGRATSKLEPGERILMIKGDGSLLVHRPVGYEPVNWQPPGCIFHTQIKNGLLELRAVRKKPEESVVIFFDRVQLVFASNLVDPGQFSLYASEEDMHQAILAEPSLLEEGFKPISYEKRIEPGFIDIYGVDRSGKLVVVEVKRRRAGKDAALQLARYIDAVRDKANRDVRGILAAPNIAKDVQRLLVTLGLEFKQVDPKKCAETLKRTETKKLIHFFGAK